MASTQFATTTHYVVPTRNDVAPAGYEGYGRVLQELTFVPLLRSIGGNGGFVVTGLELPAAGAGITSKTVTAGEAVIDGYRVATHSTAFSIDLYDNTTNYIYLRLLKSLAKVTEVVIEVNDTGTAPADSLLLGTCLTSSGSISTTVDMRPTNFGLSGYYRGDGSTATETIAALDGERCSMFCLTDYNAPEVSFFVRVADVSEVRVTIDDGGYPAVTAVAFDTYFKAGGITRTYNTNNYLYSYVILA